MATAGRGPGEVSGICDEGRGWVGAIGQRGCEQWAALICKPGQKACVGVRGGGGENFRKRRGGSGNGYMASGCCNMRWGQQAACNKVVGF